MCWSSKICTIVPEIRLELQARFCHLSSPPVEYGKTAVYPYLSNFVIQNGLQSATYDLLDCGVELLPRNRVFELEYADDFTFLSDDEQSIQRSLDGLEIEVCALHLQNACYFFKIGGSLCLFNSVSIYRIKLIIFPQTKHAESWF